MICVLNGIYKCNPIKMFAHCVFLLMVCSVGLRGFNLPLTCVDRRELRNGIFSPNLDTTNFLNLDTTNFHPIFIHFLPIWTCLLFNQSGYDQFSTNFHQIWIQKWFNCGLEIVLMTGQEIGLVS